MIVTGMPYVPGVVCGTLRLGDGPKAPDDILILPEQAIGRLGELPAGLVVVDGAPLSHPMIRWMGTGVPTVIITAEQAARLVPGTKVVLDGSRGCIRAGQHEVANPPPRPPTADGTALATADGTRVHLLASVHHPKGALQARLSGAEGIGLVRSEFLLPEDGRTPDATFYQAAFRALCAAAAPLPVTIRLLDIADDKRPRWLSGHQKVGGLLGLQGPRLFVEEPVHGVYRAQVAAVNAVQPDCALRLLIPYLVRHEELRHWVTELRQALTAPVPLGAMIETPASALDLANWFDSADFVAIGCNDLMQCFFAADRDRPELRNYLDPYAPPLYRLLKQLADAAEPHLHKVQLCGVLTQLPGVLPILLGLGYRTFSVEVALLPHFSQNVRFQGIAACRRLAAQVCQARESREVLDLMQLDFGDYRPFRA